MCIKTVARFINIICIIIYQLSTLLRGVLLYSCPHSQTCARGVSEAYCDENLLPVLAATGSSPDSPEFTYVVFTSLEVRRGTAGLWPSPASSQSPEFIAARCLCATGVPAFLGSSALGRCSKRSARRKVRPGGASVC